jgi:type I restriction enzyme S subunit
MNLSQNTKLILFRYLPFIKPGDIYPNYIEYSNEGLSFYGAEKSGRIATSNSLLMVCIGTIGKCNLVQTDCSFNQQINSVTPYIFNSNFLLAVCRSVYFNAEAWNRSSSTTIAILNKSNWEEIYIPIPPIAEQQRIVAKVDELMALCDQLENKHNNAAEAHEKLVAHLLGTLTQSQNAEDFNANWQRIAEHFDTLFTTESSIDGLKQTLLQLAVMGKLVQQDPNDEPASELLKRIQSEKAKLVAEGKIKKEKPLASITEEEKPFDLPVGWEWVHLFKIADVISGNAFKSEDFNNESGTRVIKITNTGVNELIETSDFLPESFRTKYENYIVNEGDLLLALTRPYISNGLKISKCPSSYNKSLLNQRVAAIKINNHTNEEYVYQTLKSPYVLKTYQHRFGGSGLQPNLKISDVTELLIPLSPLAEQHRIVAKVDELMAICDQLKTRITEANELQRKIADVMTQVADC